MSLRGAARGDKAIPNLVETLAHALSCAAASTGVASLITFARNDIYNPSTFKKSTVILAVAPHNNSPS